MKVEIYFETYLIIVLLFTIITVCMAGTYLKSKKSIIGFSALMVVLGFILPWLLITFQNAYGSLDKIHKLRLECLTIEDTLKGIVRHGGLPKPIPQVAFDYFTHYLGFIILAIAIGIALGILVYLLLKKQITNNIKHVE